MDDETNHLHARTPRPEDLVRICRSLNERGARYFLIGGFAVIAHGLERPTKDIDLLVDDSPENISRVKEALGVLVVSSQFSALSSQLSAHVLSSQLSTDR
jgi:hypothetical protein